jgi:F0F1-type ATP synthase beta subunit
MFEPGDMLQRYNESKHIIVLLKNSQLSSDTKEIICRCLNLQTNKTCHMYLSTLEKYYKKIA